jgi:hypothetical protein
MYDLQAAGTSRQAGRIWASLPRPISFQEGKQYHEVRRSSNPAQILQDQS